MSLVAVKKIKGGKGKIEIKWIEKKERKESFQPAFSALHQVVDCPWVWSPSRHISKNPLTLLTDWPLPSLE